MDTLLQVTLSASLPPAPAMQDPSCWIAQALEMAAPEAMLPNKSVLPTLPGYVANLQQLTASTPVDEDAIYRILRSDPASAWFVLRQAWRQKNAGERGPLSLREAWKTVGLKGLQAYLKTCPVILQQEGSSSKARPLLFWQNSFLVASLARMIASYSGDVEPGTAFTLGLVRNVRLLTEMPVLAVTEELDADRDACSGRLWQGYCSDCSTRTYCEFYVRSGYDRVKSQQDDALYQILSAASRIASVAGFALCPRSGERPPLDEQYLCDLLATATPYLPAGERLQLADRMARWLEEVSPLLDLGPDGLMKVVHSKKGWHSLS